MILLKEIFNADISISIPDEYVLVLKSNVKELNNKEREVEVCPGQASLEKMITDLLEIHMKNIVRTRYLNQKQACSYAGTSPKTMNKWVSKGLLRQIVFDDDSNPKYDLKDIDEFMKKHKIGGQYF